MVQKGNLGDQGRHQIPGEFEPSKEFVRKTNNVTGNLLLGGPESSPQPAKERAMSLDTCASVELAEIRERLRKLESENKWLKRFGVALGFGLVSLTAFGTSLIRPPAEVVAQRFVVKDQAGRTRAVLGHDGDEGSALALRDGDGKDQVLLRATPGRASSLEFLEYGSTRATFWAGPMGASALTLYDQGSTGSTSLYVRQDRDMGLDLHRGREHSQIAMGPDGILRADVLDSQELTRARAGRFAVPVQGGSPIGSRRTALAP